MKKDVVFYQLWLFIRRIVKCSIIYKRTNSGNRRTFYNLVILISTFLLSSLVVSAQTIDNLDDYKNANPSETQQIESLVDGAFSTLFIYDQGSFVKGETSPLIAEVVPSSFSELYFPHSEYAGIELLRIKVKNPDALNFVLDFDRLNNFVNLKYVYVVVTLEICPEIEGNSSCHKSKISNMFSASEGAESPIVIYKIASLM